MKKVMLVLMSSALLMFSCEKEAIETVNTNDIVQEMPGFEGGTKDPIVMEWVNIKTITITSESGANDSLLFQQTWDSLDNTTPMPSDLYDLFDGGNKFWWMQPYSQGSRPEDSDPDRVDRPGATAHNDIITLTGVKTDNSTLTYYFQVPHNENNIPEALQWCIIEAAGELRD